MSYTREPFEELDVMNFFMFSKLTTEPETSEKFCRCMLRNLLGIEVNRINVQAEKIELPDNPEKRGVRLDVKIEELDGEKVASIYDIEPHRDFEKDYPKKNRFTQSQIDKNNLESGDNDFSKLPRLFIISITNYDPFGYDRVIYTIRNACVEEPSLVYNDEVTILYFNTTGTKGGTEGLRRFLTYLEESKDTNAVDEATREVGKYVGTIKHNYELGGRYMTVGDLMDKIAAEAAAEVAAEKDAYFSKLLNEQDRKLEEKDKYINKLDIKLEEKERELQELKALLARK